MKKNILLVCLLSFLSVTSCSTTKVSDSTNSDNLSNEFSYSESISDKISEIDSRSNVESSSSEIIIDAPSKFYTINKNSVEKIYSPGQLLEFGSYWTNYIVLDKDGHIVYTVANVGCGYGKGNNYASVVEYQELVSLSIKENGFTIPNNCIGYSINYEAYGKFAYEVSNGEIEVDEFKKNGYGDLIKKWNSLENPYLNSSIGITIAEIINKDLQARNDEEFRLSSLYDISDEKGLATYKVFAPYDDTYTISCDSSEKIEIYNFNKSLLSSNEFSLTITLKKNEIVYINIQTMASDQWFNLSTTLNEHKVELPYEINSSTDISKLSTTSSNNKSPLKVANISYEKRNDGKGLYVNCNNPEALSASDMNKCLTRQDVTGKDVFFTFEHNNANTSYFYGYRVTNTDSKDIYITVKNMGYQTKGAGAWLGEDEWVKFYNTEFRVDTSSYTASQKENYNAYVAFSNNYKSENRSPITYRIPAGKYIYVMGGTTKDSYQNINVFKSANIVVNSSICGCSNGAVLFSVANGTAEGQFLVYKDKDASTINASSYVQGNDQQGYVAGDYGSQYVGDENCHGVVDCDYVWEFNDATKSTYLPVTFTNPYYVGNQQINGTAHSKIPNIIGYENINIDTWYTHLNGNHLKSTAGTDMTVYNTINSNKEKIIIDQLHFDGKGNTSNIGNWMVDYIDTITLVNQGDKERTFTYSLSQNGVILAFIRNMDGSISNTYKPTYCIRLGKNEYGDAIEQPFTYSISIPAHSIIQFAVNYNLLANSSGCIAHRAYLS